MLILNTMRKAIFAILLTLTCFVACTRAPQNPDTPIIEFRDISNFTNYNSDGNIVVDSVQIGIYFKDGTGDLGLAQSDTLSKYKFKIDSSTTNGVKKYKFNRNYYNYWLDMYIKRNGKYEIVNAVSDYVTNSAYFKPYDGRFIPFNENYKDDKSPIEGYLRIKFDILPFINTSEIFFEPQLAYEDSIKFSVRILDRKLNISDTVFTPAIKVLRYK